jgi:hypothetical protein
MPSVFCVTSATGGDRGIVWLSGGAGGADVGNQKISKCNEILGSQGYASAYNLDIVDGISTELRGSVRSSGREGQRRKIAVAVEMKPPITQRL